jgi:NDP-sugar pyrophosphorylase family protein
MTPTRFSDLEQANSLSYAGCQRPYVRRKSPKHLAIPNTCARNAKGLQRRRKTYVNPIKYDSVMKAMIFAAGMGTRLLPLTRHKPKALVEVNGKPLLQHLIERMKRYGIKEIIVNLHHHAGQIQDFLKQNNNFGIHIAVSDETEHLLDTGGGLKKAAWFFNDGNPLILHNVDVITDLDLGEIYRYHRDSRALATLAVRTRKTSRYLLFDHDMRLGGWENVKTGESIIVEEGTALNRFAFSGIHVVDPALLSMIIETGRFSIIDAYLRLAGSQIIKGYLHDHTEWIDVGKTDDLKRSGHKYDGEGES